MNLLSVLHIISESVEKCLYNLHCLRHKPSCCTNTTHNDDDQTAVTANTASTSSKPRDQTTGETTHTMKPEPVSTTWTRIGGSALIPARGVCQPVQQPKHYLCAFSTRNYYAPLDILDNECIGVDSGASDNFGTDETPGTDPRPVRTGIIMAVATGDRRKSIGANKFPVPLPPSRLDFHVFRRTTCSIHYYLLGRPVMPAVRYSLLKRSVHS